MDIHKEEDGESRLVAEQQPQLTVGSIYYSLHQKLRLTICLTMIRHMIHFTEWFAVSRGPVRLSEFWRNLDGLEECWRNL